MTCGRFIFGHGRCNAVQMAVLKRIATECMERFCGNESFIEPAHCFESLHQVCRGRSVYETLPSHQGDVAKMEIERLSLPMDVHGAPHLEDVLAGQALERLRCLEAQLRPPSEIVALEEALGKVQPYMDPSLKGRKFEKLVIRLREVGLVSFTRKPVCYVGTFAVWKKGGEKQRIIVDARSTNRLFCPPPPVQLCTSEAFSRIEIPSEFGNEAVEICVSDIKDCFHRFLLPSWLRGYFCLPGVIAGHVGAREADDKAVDSQCMVYPCWNSLPMGWSWSVYFAQEASQSIMLEGTGIQRDLLMTDLCADMRLGVAPRHYVYIDNLGLIGFRRYEVCQVAESCKEVFRKKQLELHDESNTVTEVDVLGVSLSAERGCVRVSAKKFFKVWNAIGQLLRKGSATGEQMQMLVGHMTFVGLIERSCLSILHSVYAFVLKAGESQIPLWASVIEELRAFRSVMVLLSADWKREWSSTVLASDASEYGWGVCSSEWDSEQVARVGR
eukprot:342789-Amphidinium_carterae.3